MGLVEGYAKVSQHHDSGRRLLRHIYVTHLSSLVLWSIKEFWDEDVDVGIDAFLYTAQGFRLDTELVILFQS